MKRTVYHIIRLTLILSSVVLTVANSAAQTFTVYQGETIELSVDQGRNYTYSWELYNDPTGIDFANDLGNALADEAYFVDGDNEGATVNVTWLEPGEYFFRVMAWDEVACTNNVKVGRLEVLESIPTAAMELFPDEICVNDDAILTINFTGTPDWTFDLEVEDEFGTHTETYTSTEAEYVLTVSPVVTTTYRITRVVNEFGESVDQDEVTLTVHPLPEMSPIYIVE